MMDDSISLKTRHDNRDRRYSANLMVMSGELCFFDLSGRVANEDLHFYDPRDLDWIDCAMK